MFKADNGHHFKEPHMAKTCKNAFATWRDGTVTPTYGSYGGITFASGTPDKMVFNYGDYLLQQDRDFTFDVYMYPTDLSNTRYIFAFGKQNNATNYITIGTNTQQYPYISIYDAAGNQKQWISNIRLSAGYPYKVSYAYNRSMRIAEIVVNGSRSIISAGGAGVGYITPSLGNRYWVGADTWSSNPNTACLFAGQIMQLQYTPYFRSVNDMIRRQADVGKLFPMDKYSTMDWNAKNKLVGWIRTVQSKRKYTEV